MKIDNQNVRRTTAIGSLPHHNVDAALEFSFKLGIPFLPQIPRRNPSEYMIANALDGLPGLEVDKDGSVVLNLDIWQTKFRAFEEKLNLAFSKADADVNAFEDFAPTIASSGAWQPFVWELEERKTPLAKIQIAGPLTCQWALVTTSSETRGGSQETQTADRVPQLSSQIFKLVLARSLAMCRQLRKAGVPTLLFLDEPGLFGLTSQNPRHLLGLQELKVLIQALKKENIKVGIHCCSNTDWALLLGDGESQSGTNSGLGLDLLSIDASLSLESLLLASSQGHAGKPLTSFLAKGGQLALGVVNTRIGGAKSAPSEGTLSSFDARGTFDQLVDILRRSKTPFSTDPDLVKKLFRESIFTPACGLALLSIPDSEEILDATEAFESYCRNQISRPFQ
jgi:hypothetical protein